MILSEKNIVLEPVVDEMVEIGYCNDGRKLALLLDLKAALFE
jgi:hypothetical protein